jgi:hypothetical protein
LDGDVLMGCEEICGKFVMNIQKDSENILINSVRKSLESSGNVSKILLNPRGWVLVVKRRLFLVQILTVS